MSGSADPADEFFPERQVASGSAAPSPPDVPGRANDGSGLPSYLGDVFEVSAKLGIACCLVDRGLVERGHPVLEPFFALTNEGMLRHVQQQLAIVDEGFVDQLRTEVSNVRLQGYFLGYGTMRDYLAGLGDGVEMKALWMGLELRDRNRDDYRDRAAATAESFCRTFALPDGAVGPISAGDPPQADLMAVFADGSRVDLLVLEFSLHAPAEIRDFRLHDAHLDEVAAFARAVERRGVFASVSAEVSGEGFAVSSALVSNLAAFSSGDKPLYKLAQASSYATGMSRLLARHGLLPERARLVCMALTSRGVEALRADAGTGVLDPRLSLMERLGAAYRTSPRSSTDAEFAHRAEAILGHLAKGLPRQLREQAAPLLDPSRIGLSTGATIRETVEGFVNPAEALERDAALSWVREDSGVAAFLGEASAREALARHLPPGGRTDLRALHAAGIRAALSSVRVGEMKVVAAEGTPGIGKTTSVVRSLADREEGFLFVYISPRVLINTDVTAEICRAMPGRVLAATTNHTVNSGAARYYREVLVPGGADPGRVVEGGVIVDGLGDMFADPGTSVLPLTREQADDLHDDHGDRTTRSRVTSAREKDLYERPNPGVLSTLAGFARSALSANPSVDRLVLTAAIQSYKDLGNGRSTISGLDRIFASKPHLPAGLAERRQFARRFPTVLVMVDEITGDGAGVPIVHALAAWLRAQFVDPFQGNSPFRVGLVVADASLGNSEVFDRYLQIGDRAPERVLISRGRPGTPFALAASRQRFGDPQTGPRLPVLHVMADSFPAGRLDVEYVVATEPVEVPGSCDGGPPSSARAAIRQAVGEDVLAKACAQVTRNLAELRRQGDADGQVILFAQDKALLREIADALTASQEAKALGLRPDDVAILDSSVSIRRRRHILEHKNGYSVLLMTSSGARGISFPRARAIVTLVPRFSLESGLMEIGQLVYRGRGAVGGVPMDGLDRKLVFLLNDYVVRDPGERRDDLEVKRRWLRQATDLTTFLLLLRGALLTRMTGDAGLPGQSLAIIPVGHVGADGVETTLSEAVATFLSEAQVALREKGVPAELKGLLVRASQELEEQCSQVEVRGTLGCSEPGGRSDPAAESVLSPFMEHARRHLTSPNVVLGEALGELSMPDRTRVLGPLLLERWDGIRVREVIHSDLLGNTRAAARRSLLAALRELEAAKGLAKGIRAAAFKLLEILRPPPTTAPTDAFASGRDVESDHFWVAVPLDYTALDTSRDAVTGLGPMPGLRSQDEWLSVMERAAYCFHQPSLSLPAVAAFKTHPFIAFVARGDVTGGDRIFSDRQFMASTELNMLNALFLGD